MKELSNLPRVCSMLLSTTEDNRPLPQWQGLTDDELREMLGYGKDGYIPDYTRNFVDAIEAMLKEKNSG